jgi:nitroreductase/NAD-dependent dihydropyrimidine dehydrogenase PreA subunit
MARPVVIDEKRCTACGACVEVCPYNSLELSEGKALYVLDTCFLCGHCYAICPENAISLTGYKESLGLTTIEELTELIKPAPRVASELVSIMRSRRSCRKYSSTPVSVDMLSDLVKIGTTAPSGTNSQMWSFGLLPERPDLMVLGELVAKYYRKLNRQAESSLLRGLMKIFGSDSLGNYYRNYYESVEEALQKWEVKGEDSLFHGAAAGILVSGKRQASCPAEDCLLATQNILLAAHMMGLGTCLIGFAVEAMRRDKSIREKMEIADDEEIYSVIVIGHPAVKYSRHSVRRSVTPNILEFATRD